METASLPVINFAAFGQGDGAQKRAIAHHLDTACRQTGFFYLTGHALPSEQIRAMFDQSRAFFAQPLAAKQKGNWSHAESNRGYGGIGREQLNPDGPADYKETLNLGWEAPDSHLPQNPWPQDLPNFQPIAQAFFRDCIAVAQQVFEALAIALDLPPHFFIDHHNQNPFTLRLLHYPPLPTHRPAQQLRAGEHTNYGTITLLFLEAGEGLEVQTVDGVWRSVPPQPDAIVVNLGDLMARWTNHRYRSTPHRVVAGEGDRYSIAFFCDANPTTEIACLPSCQSPDNPPRYPPIRAGEYLISRLTQTYGS